MSEGQSSYDEAKEEEEQSNKRSHLDAEEVAVSVVEENEVTEEDEDSEPSSDEG